MYRSGTVKLLCCEGFFLLLAILCSRYELVVTNVAGISRSSRNISTVTLVNATEVLIPNKNCSGLETCVIEFRHFQVPSDKPKVIIFNGRFNDKYNSTHFVNTSADPAYLVITGVELQHAGTYTFGKLEGGFFGSIDLSVYGMPNCQWNKDSALLICNVSYAGFGSPRMNCSYGTRQHNREELDVSLTNHSNNETEFSFSRNSLTLDHLPDYTWTLWCSLNISAGLSTYNWTFSKEWNGKSGPTHGDGDGHRIIIIAVSALGAVILITNVIILVLLIQRRVTKANRSQDISLARRHSAPDRSRPEIRYTNHSRTGTLTSIAETDGIYAEISSRPGSKCSTLNMFKPDLVPDQHVPTESQRQPIGAKPPVYTAVNRKKEPQSTESQKTDVTPKFPKYSEINRNKKKPESVYSYSEVKEVKLRWSLEAEKEKEPQPPPVTPYNPSDQEVLPSASDTLQDVQDQQNQEVLPSASDTLQDVQDQENQEAPSEYYDSK